jgi:hypothetical protein
MYRRDNEKFIYFKPVVCDHANDISQLHCTIINMGKPPPPPQENKLSFAMLITPTPCI